jgi:hypothetical protein
MVMFAVEIKVLFQRVKDYFHHEGHEEQEEKLIFVFFVAFVVARVKQAWFRVLCERFVGHR